jgi:hypothetical protein
MASSPYTSFIFNINSAEIGFKDFSFELTMIQFLQVIDSGFKLEILQMMQFYRDL